MHKTENSLRVVADTSIIINGQLVDSVKSGSLHDCEIILPQAVFDEIQSQASQKKEQGFVGLEEIKKLQDLSDEFSLIISLKGDHPTTDDIRLASSGRIDTLIKDVAKQNSAILYTSDNVQHLAAQAECIESVLLRPNHTERLEFLRYFDSQTMSVHLKEGLHPVAKKGMPGSFSLESLGEKPLSQKYLESISSEILEAASVSDSGTIEMSLPGASVVQYGDYRIAMTRPPFSECLEITIVHPIAKLSLDDYSISESLMERFSDAAKGVLISGPPGSGKSTLASGLANFYNSLGKIVKTFESPRDLQVNPGITQYTKLAGSFENTADILLLVRPDYTIFDEVRRREDFQTFSDLRLAGVGMVGVVHASAPLDAIQRFIGKIELGMIPNVLDTVVFVEAGKIGKVYDLSLRVKVPTGMTESDLARPVIEIRDFEDNTLEHEIYTFGEENVIVPVSGPTQKTGMEKLAEDKIREIFQRYDSSVKVKVISANSVRVMVDEHRIAPIIGRGGSNITSIEKSLGIHIDVVARDSNDFTAQGDLPFTFSESKTSLMLAVGREYSSMYADICVGERHVTSVRIGRKGQIKIPKRSEASRHLADIASSKSDIRVSLRGS